MDPISTVKSIVKLLQDLKNIVKEVKYNSASCHRLVTRCEALEAPIKKLETRYNALPKNHNFDFNEVKGLKNLRNLFMEISSFIEEFQQPGLFGNVTRVAYRTYFASEMLRLNEALDRSVADMSFIEIVQLGKQQEINVAFLVKEFQANISQAMSELKKQPNNDETKEIVKSIQSDIEGNDSFITEYCQSRGLNVSESDRNLILREQVNLTNLVTSQYDNIVSLLHTLIERGPVSDSHLLDTLGTQLRLYYQSDLESMIKLDVGDRKREVKVNELFVNLAIVEEESQRLLEIRELEKESEKIAPRISEVPEDETSVGPNNKKNKKKRVMNGALGLYNSARNAVGNDSKGVMNDSEDIYSTKINIKSENLFNEHTLAKGGRKITPKDVLLLGRAGVGKTTLCRYLAYRWSTGDLWSTFDSSAKDLNSNNSNSGGDNFEFKRESSVQNINNQQSAQSQLQASPVQQIGFKYIFYLRLKEVANVAELKTETKIPTILFHTLWRRCQIPERDCETLWNTIIRGKDKILFILDGYDEVSSERHPACEELMQIRKQYFNNDIIHVLTTSRPHATISKSVDLVLEDVGFLDEDIPKYIHKYLVEWSQSEHNDVDIKSAEDLVDWLMKRPNVHQICHVPINLELLCSIWTEQHESMKSEDLVMSDLYQRMLSKLMRRYLMRKISITEFNAFVSQYNQTSTFTHILTHQICQDALLYLEELAYVGFQSGNLIISAELFASFAQKHGKPFQDSIAHFLESGFLKAVGTTSFNPNEVDNGVRDYYFIHLSFQEYLTARYFARLFMNSKVTDVDRAFIVLNKYHPRYKLIWTYVCGVISTWEDLKGNKRQISDKISLGIKRYFRTLLRSTRDLYGVYELELLVRCAEEAKWHQCETTSDLLLYLGSWVMQMSTLKADRDLAPLLRQLSGLFLSCPLAMAKIQYNGRIQLFNFLTHEAVLPYWADFLIWYGEQIFAAMDALATYISSGQWLESMCNCPGYVCAYLFTNDEARCKFCCTPVKFICNPIKNGFYYACSRCCTGENSLCHNCVNSCDICSCGALKCCCISTFGEDLDNCCYICDTANESCNNRYSETICYKLCGKIWDGFAFLVKFVFISIGGAIFVICCIIGVVLLLAYFGVPFLVGISLFGILPYFAALLVSEQYKLRAKVMADFMSNFKFRDELVVKRLVTLIRNSDGATCSRIIQAFERSNFADNMTPFIDEVLHELFLNENIQLQMTSFCVFLKFQSPAVMNSHESIAKVLTYDEEIYLFNTAMYQFFFDTLMHSFSAKSVEKEMKVGKLINAVSFLHQTYREEVCEAVMQVAGLFMMHSRVFAPIIYRQSKINVEKMMQSHFVLVLRLLFEVSGLPIPECLEVLCRWEKHTMKNSINKPLYERNNLHKLQAPEYAVKTMLSPKLISNAVEEEPDQEEVQEPVEPEVEEPWEENPLFQPKSPVAVVSGYCDIRGDFMCCSDAGGFPSVGCADFPVTEGKWYFEVTVVTAGCIQIGWADSYFTGDSYGGMGVGDDLHSWAFDGYRTCTWHKSKTEWGASWKRGDVVGCALDCDNKIMSFYLNGQGEEIGMGVAYEGYNNMGPMYPCVCFNRHEKIRFNFGGDTDFAHPAPEGYRAYSDVIQAKRLSDLENAVNDTTEVAAESKNVMDTGVEGAAEEKPSVGDSDDDSDSDAEDNNTTGQKIQNRKHAIGMRAMGGNSNENTFAAENHASTDNVNDENAVQPPWFTADNNNNNNDNDDEAENDNDSNEIEPQEQEQENNIDENSYNDYRKSLFDVVEELKRAKTNESQLSALKVLLQTRDFTIDEKSEKDEIMRYLLRLAFKHSFIRDLYILWIPLVVVYGVTLGVLIYFLGHMHHTVWYVAGSITAAEIIYMLIFTWDCRDLAGEAFHPGNYRSVYCKTFGGVSLSLLFLIANVTITSMIYFFNNELELGFELESEDNRLPEWVLSFSKIHLEIIDEVHKIVEQKNYFSSFLENYPYINAFNSYSGLKDVLRTNFSLHQTAIWRVNRLSSVFYWFDGQEEKRIHCRNAWKLRHDIANIRLLNKYFTVNAVSLRFGRQVSAAVSRRLKRNKKEDDEDTEIVSIDAKFTEHWTEAAEQFNKFCTYQRQHARKVNMSSMIPGVMVMNRLWNGKSGEDNKEKPGKNNGKNKLKAPILDDYDQHENV